MKEMIRKRFAVRAFDVRNVAWWLFVVLGVAGVTVLALTFTRAVEVFPVAFWTAVVLSFPLAWAWWLLLRIPQLWARISRSGALAALAWGALVAPTLYALHANGALLTASAQRGSISFAQSWGPALVAPLTEETGKAFAIVAVLLLSRQSLRTPMDGALIAAFSAVGFTVTEDVIYAINIASLNLGENEVISTLLIYLVRAVIFGAVTHVVFSALVGAGIGWIVTARTRSRVPVGLALIGAGAAAHGLWNSPLLASWWARLAYVVLVPFAMWLLLHRIRRHEHAWFLRTLSAPDALGAIPPGLVASVGGTWWKRRAIRASVTRAYGDGALPYQRRVEAALSDLADAIAAGDGKDAARIRSAIESWTEGQAATKAT